MSAKRAPDGQRRTVKRVVYLSDEEWRVIKARAEAAGMRGNAYMRMFGVEGIALRDDLNDIRFIIDRIESRARGNLIARAEERRAAQPEREERDDDESDTIAALRQELAAAKAQSARATRLRDEAAAEAIALRDTVERWQRATGCPTPAAYGEPTQPAAPPALFRALESA